jgi:Fe-S-cluster containining protein
VPTDKIFPEGLTPLGTEPFSFSCHPEVSCFTVCCRRVDLDLYPYDIIRLKRSLKIDSETFLRRHTELKKGGNPFFPTVKLKLRLLQNEPVCPFLQDDGCRVYQDRPTACRTYPLERAVDRTPVRGVTDDYYFLTRHDYCRGHLEDRVYTVKQWVRGQRLDAFNAMNDLWAEIDTLFSKNPWKGEGSGGPRQQLAFMTCYNVDGFRTFVNENRVLEQFVIDRDQKKQIARIDEELLKFGFAWLKSLLGGRTGLVRK